MKVAVFAVLLSTVVDASRFHRRFGESSRISVECTLDFICAEPDEDAPAGVSEFAECTTGDMTSYELSVDDVTGFKSDDLVSMVLEPTEERTSVGDRLYKAESVKLLQRPDKGRVSTQATGHSFLVILASYSDGYKPDFSSSHLKARLMDAIEQMRNASYGKFPDPEVNIKVMTVNMPQRWMDYVNADASSSSVRKDIYARVPEEASYTYRQIWVPRSDPKLFSSPAFANSGCPPSEAPRNGHCYSMYAPKIGGWEIMAHEMGHNFGIHHAASIIEEDLSSSGNVKEYGDDRNIMGSSGNNTGRHYVSASRDKLQWLPSGEVKTASEGVFKLSNLQNTELHSRRRNSHVAVKVPCPGCQDHLWGKTGGDLYVSYSEGKIAVHFTQDGWSRTEAWSRLDLNGNDVDKYSDQPGTPTVRFCKEVGRNQAYVGISNTFSGSQRWCDEGDANPLD